MFCLSSALLLVISPFKGSILLQHVERLQLLHDIVSLVQPLLCLRNRVRYILNIVNVCVNLQIYASTF